MGAVSKALSITEPFVFDGRKYALEVRSLDTEGLLETWLEDRALQAIRRHAESMSPGEYSELLRIWDEACATGVYSFNSPNYWRVMMTATGLKQRAYLDLKQANPRVTEELIDRIMKDTAKTPTARKDVQGKPVTETKWQELHRRIDEVNNPNPPEPDAGTESESEADVPDAPPPAAPPETSPPETPPALAG